MYPVFLHSSLVVADLDDDLDVREKAVSPWRRGPVRSKNRQDLSNSEWYGHGAES